LKFQEVHEAMSTTLLQKKDEWLTPDFFNKMAANPTLMKAF
jgi:hypothetical protein